VVQRSEALLLERTWPRFVELNGSFVVVLMCGQFIQNDFVAERKAAPTVTADDLIHRMIVAR
jgi:hypothetical protein